MLSSIEISIKGDYEWSPEEQEFHENLIWHFKHYLEKTIESSGLKMGVPVFVNGYYLPADRSFLIYKITRAADRLSREITSDPNLKRYKPKIELKQD